MEWLLGSHGVLDRVSGAYLRSPGRQSHPLLARRHLWFCPGIHRRSFDPSLDPRFSAAGPDWGTVCADKLHDRCGWFLPIEKAITVCGHIMHDANVISASLLAIFGPHLGTSRSLLFPNLNSLFAGRNLDLHYDLPRER